MKYTIALHDGTIAITYWSASKRFHPSGHWGEKQEALKFQTTEAAQEFINTILRHQADLCKVTPVE